MIEPAIETIRTCLTTCTECTGRYISDILRKRFICCCRCHSTKSLHLFLEEADVGEKGFLNSSAVIGVATYDRLDKTKDYKHYRCNAQKMNKVRDYVSPKSAITNELDGSLGTHRRYK